MKVIFFDFETQLFLGSAASLKYLGNDVIYMTKTNDYPSQKLLSVESMPGKPVQICKVEIPFSNTDLCRIKSLLRYNRNLFNAIRYFEPDIIACYPYGSDIWWHLYPICKKLRIPLVSFFYGIRGFWLKEIVSFTRDYLEFIRAPLNILHTFITSRSSDLVVTHSDIIKALLRKIGINNVITVNPSYARVFSQNSGNEINVQLKNPSVLTILTLERRGNVEFEIESLKLLMCVARQLREITFVVVGTTTEKLKLYASIFNASLPENITGLGYIQDVIVLEEIYKQSYCVVDFWPFNWNWGTSIRVLEALFYGKALITRTSRTLMLRDIKNYKEVILVNNIPQYAYWIRKIVSDDDFRSQLEHNARQYYLHKLSPLIQGKHLEKYFNSIVIKYEK